MKVNQSTIRKMAVRYRNWLTNQKWFNLKVKNQKAWLAPIDAIINKEARTATAIWECVVDHWHETSWNEDSRPSAFEELYELVDEYRTALGVDAANSINFLLNELKHPVNNDKAPQEVFSELYEKLSGDTLEREIDPDTGEAYFYKRNADDCKYSQALHPEVAEYFNLRNNHPKVGGVGIFASNLTHYQIADQLRTNSCLLMP